MKTRPIMWMSATFRCSHRRSPALKRAAALTVALALGACASQPGTPARPPAPVTQAGPAATQPSERAPTPTAGADGKPAPVSNTLAAERRYLQDWFGGTPVTIDLDREGVLRVDVPLQNAFDIGQHRPKPALGKVLEHVATSLRRVPAARVAVTAPDDPGRSNAALVERRLTAVRDAIAARGVNAIRLNAGGALGTSPLPTATAAPMVSLRISLPSAP